MTVTEIRSRNQAVAVAWLARRLRWEQRLAQLEGRAAERKAC